MARIKVTGYIDTDDMDPSDVDLTHSTGLKGGDNQNLEDTCRLADLEELQFELVKD